MDKRKLNKNKKNKKEEEIFIRELTEEQKNMVEDILTEEILNIQSRFSADSIKDAIWKLQNDGII